jgi:hypothetical protein
MIGRIVWWCLLDPLFLSITSYTRTSILYCRHSGEQQALSLLCCPSGRMFFLLFFFYVSQHIHRVSALLGQLCSLCFSRSRSCVIHLRERGGTSSSFHAYMHCECTCVRCASGNEHVMNEKNFLFPFFLFDLNFFSSVSNCYLSGIRWIIF